MQPCCGPGKDAAVETKPQSRGPPPAKPSAAPNGTPIPPGSRGDKRRRGIPSRLEDKPSKGSPSRLEDKPRKGSPSRPEDKPRKESPSRPEDKPMPQWVREARRPESPEGWPEDDDWLDDFEALEDPWEGVKSPAHRETMSAFHEAVEASDLDALDALIMERGLGLSKANRAAVRHDRERLVVHVRRAANEQLAAAMRSNSNESNCREKLENAIEVAKRRGIDKADIEEAEIRFASLDDASDEPAIIRSGRPAFAAIRNDDVAALRKAIVRPTRRGCRAWARWQNEHTQSLLEAAESSGSKRCLAHLSRDGGLTEEQWKDLFKLVARDDAVELSRVLVGCSPLVWATRRNAGGKTLLELAQERGKQKAEVWLMLASGTVDEMEAPGPLRSGDSAWVLDEDAVQPRPANVVTVEKHEVIVAYWDSETGTCVVPLHNCRRMRD